MIHRRWIIGLLLLAIGLTILLWLQHYSTQKLLNDIYSNTYKGDVFSYWSIYQGMLYFLPLPIASLISIIVWLLTIGRPHSQKLNTYLPFAGATFLILDLLLAMYAVFIIFKSDPPLIRHLATLQLREDFYHLGGMYYIAGNDRLVVYRCDKRDTICHVEYIQEYRTYIKDLETEFVVDSIMYAPVITLKVEGETVYTTAQSD